MKLSSRLQACADLVRVGNTAADIGTDHGYLPIYLYLNGISPKVFAADLREKPLESAKSNAKRYGVEDKILFCLSDGLLAVPVEQVQTVICAGMGGDCIAEILRGRPDVHTSDRQFILQPQSAAAELRQYLYENGFQILRERFARDGRFVYAVIEAVIADIPEKLEPGHEYLPQGDIDSADPLYHAYLDRVEKGLTQTVENMHRGRDVDPDKLKYFETALRFVKGEREYAQG